MGRRRILVSAELITRTLETGNRIEPALVSDGLPPDCKISGVGVVWCDSRIDEAHTVWVEVEHPSFAGGGPGEAPIGQSIKLDRI